MRWSLIAAVNDNEVLESSLLRSPDVATATDVILERGFPSAGAAYNSGLAKIRGDIAVFAHQDVYFPPGWIHGLEERIHIVNDVDPHWGVLGVFGMDKAGAAHGHVYSTGLKRILGGPSRVPVEVDSVDEMVIVLRKESGLSFDSGLPGFHLYGTDICLEARRRRLRAFVVPNFCVHNSNGLDMLPWAFWKSYLFIRSKWRDSLPVVTPCATIHPSVLRLGSYVLGGFSGKLRKRASPGRRVESPSQLYEDLCRRGRVTVEPQELSWQS